MQDLVDQRAPAPGMALRAARAASRRSAIAIGIVAALAAGLLAVDGTLAASKRERCLAAASELLGSRVRGKDYRLVLGSGRDDRLRASARPDLICGFGGHDRLVARGPALRKGDIFVGGPGRDRVQRLKGGRFAGGDHDDTVLLLLKGSFEGGAGVDVVEDMRGGTFVGGGGSFDWVTRQSGGLFDGGPGEDEVERLSGGTFAAGEGQDVVNTQSGGSFEGGEGDEVLARMRDGLYDGGPGDDLVWEYHAGALIDVEECREASEEAVCP